MSIKDQEKNKKINLIQEMKKTTLYKSVLEKFPDANLLSVKLNKKDEN